MIAFDRVEKSYDGQTVLGPITLDFAAGRTHVLIGPSGCGKSTLLRLLVGLIEPDAGTIRFQDRALGEWDLLQHRRSLGYVIQEGGLFPHLTAVQNVALVARHVGWDESRITKRVTELAELTHFPIDGLERFPRELSGGQRQRVGLMRALMLQPEVLLLDEPLGALDPMIRANLQRDLKEIFQTLKATVLFVTHDLNEAAWLGDSITLFRAGSIAQRGTIDDLSQRPADAFVTEFLSAQRAHWQ